jgi:glyoxylase-like metal-dependent hydrolase (beta-lactamase superfamily II)
VVQRREWEAATDPDRARLDGYDRRDFDLGLEVVAVEGEHDLFGDGSIVCLPTPGHTLGHQALLRDAGARVFYGHDPGFRAEVPQAPSEVR